MENSHKPNNHVPAPGSILRSWRGLETGTREGESPFFDKPLKRDMDLLYVIVPRSSCTFRWTFLF
jgi:hypothetical protein